MKPLPTKLEQVYECHYANHTQPGFKELQDIFLLIVQQLDSAFFVLDALDECTLDQRTDLCKFFKELVERSSTGTSNGIIKLFVASRKAPDIERAFQHKSFPSIEVEAEKVDSDIELYVKAQIDQRLDDGSLTLSNLRLKDKILTALTTKAGGMYDSLSHYSNIISNQIHTNDRFLWVELQLETICAKVSDYGIEKALENIPEDLDATYHRILNMINKKPREQYELAKKVFLFITYAREPLSIDTLALAIAVEHPTQSLDTLRSSISTEKMILNVCGNLISIDKHPNTRHVRFLHFSVHEFFTSYRSNTPHALCLEEKVAQREIARMCMTFLLILYSQIQDYCTVVECSFTNYSLHALPHHLLASDLNILPLNDEMVNLTISFFGKSPPLAGPFQNEAYLTLVTFSPSLLALIFNLPCTYQHYDSQLLFGEQLNQEVLEWVYGRIHRSTKFVLLSDNRLAMHYVTDQLDSVTVAKRLFIHGYPIDYLSHKVLGTLYNFPIYVNSLEMIVGTKFELTPIYFAKSVRMAEFFLDSGASVMARFAGGVLCSLIEYVAEGGNAEVVQLLFDRGVEQDKGTQRTTTEIMLYNAAYRGEVKALQHLLDKGAEVNARGGKYGNALQAASYGCSVEAIQLLLDNGADVNAQGGEYGHALQAAAHGGKAEAIQLLLDNGADVNAQGGGRFGTALQAAAFIGNVEAIQLLLDNGADVNVQVGPFGTALQAAANIGKVEAIQLLLNSGADVNAGGRLGTALQAAAYVGKVEVIQLLLDNGADVNAQGGEFSHSLQAAAYFGKVEVIQLLLDNGAEVNAQGGRFGTALQAAACIGKVEAIQLLLDHGADVNAQGGEYGNALQAAAYCSVEAIQLFLDNGADVNAQGGRFGTALQAAAYIGKVEAIQPLIDNGADVNAQGGFHGNALQAAAYIGKVEAIQPLLDNGADVNAQGGKHGNALQAAAWMGKVEVIQLLLDNGADINAQGGYYGTALQAAAYFGKVEAIQLLLDNGAEVNAQGGRFGNALQAAALFGKVEAIQLILDNGADVNAQGGYYGNALQAAAYRAKIEAIHLILDMGADVNTRGGRLGTALQAILEPDKEARSTTLNVLCIVELLLDHGADITVNVPSSKYGDALAAAKELWKHEPANLARFMELLESRGWKEGELSSGTEEHRQVVYSQTSMLAYSIIL